MKTASNRNGLPNRHRQVRTYQTSKRALRVLAGGVLLIAGFGAFLLHRCSRSWELSEATPARLDFLAALLCFGLAIVFASILLGRLSREKTITVDPLRREVLIRQRLRKKPMRVPFSSVQSVEISYWNTLEAASDCREKNGVLQLRLHNGSTVELDSISVPTAAGPLSSGEHRRIREIAQTGRLLASVTGKRAELRRDDSMDLNDRDTAYLNFDVLEPEVFSKEASPSIRL